jgi:hypothetical protein
MRQEADGRGQEGRGYKSLPIVPSGDKFQVQDVINVFSFCHLPTAPCLNIILILEIFQSNDSS